MSALQTMQLAHDLRLMLRVMAQCTESLRTRFIAEAPMDADLIQLEGAIDNAFYISRELASISRPRTIGPAVVDLNELIIQALPVIQRMAGRSVRIALKLEATEPIIEAEAVPLEWIMLNLAANARDAMPDGGLLTIKTVSIAPRTRTPVTGPKVRLTMADNGVGMSEETRERLTHPFFSTKPNAQGFGLTSVELLVRELRGTLSVESAEGSGTFVQIELPVLARAGR